MRGVPCVKSHINQSYEGVVLDLELKDNHIFVAGDSATGKSFIWSILDKIKAMEEYSYIVTFNYTDINMNILEQLKIFHHKLIVIDNADILLDCDCRNHIAFDFSNQYIIIGRKANGLLFSRNNLVSLAFDNNVFTFKYYI